MKEFNASFLYRQDGELCEVFQVIKSSSRAVAKKKAVEIARLNGWRYLALSEVSQ